MEESEACVERERDNVATLHFFISELSSWIELCGTHPPALDVLNTSLDGRLTSKAHTHDVVQALITQLENYLHGGRRLLHQKARDLSTRRTFWSRRRPPLRAVPDSPGPQTCHETLGTVLSDPPPSPCRSPDRTSSRSRCSTPFDPIDAQPASSPAVEDGAKVSPQDATDRLSGDKDDEKARTKREGTSSGKDRRIEAENPRKRRRELSEDGDMPLAKKIERWQDQTAHDAETERRNGHIVQQTPGAVHQGHDTSELPVS